MVYRTAQKLYTDGLSADRVPGSGCDPATQWQLTTVSTRISTWSISGTMATITIDVRDRMNEKYIPISAVLYRSQDTGINAAMTPLESLGIAWSLEKDAMGAGKLVLNVEVVDDDSTPTGELVLVYLYADRVIKL